MLLTSPGFKIYKKNQNHPPFAPSESPVFKTDVLLLNVLAEEKSIPESYSEVDNEQEVVATELTLKEESESIAN